MRRLIVVWTLVAAASAEAGGARDVRLTWLPTRTANTVLRDEATAIARDVATRVGGTLVAAPSSAERAQVLDGLARAKQLYDQGAVDEAADAYDVAILRGQRAVLQIGDGAELVRGVVARIGIALARGERARARDLARWLLRVDPAFALDTSEHRPSLATELASAAQSQGAAPPLSVDDLGACEPSNDVTIVARNMRAGEIELRRVDECRLGDVVRLTSEHDHGASVRALAGVDALPLEDSHHDRPALYRRPWFWAAVGVVAVGAAATWYTVDRGESREVVPHW